MLLLIEHNVLHSLTFSDIINYSFEEAHFVILNYCIEISLFRMLLKCLSLSSNLNNS